MDSLDLEVIDEFLNVLNEGDEVEKGMRWWWPDNWGLATREKFQDRVCDIIGCDKGPTNEVKSYMEKGDVFKYVRYIVDDALDKGQLDQDNAPEEVALADDEVLLTDEESARIMELARDQAKRNHDCEQAGGGTLHEGYFDECDHPDCKLTNEFETKGQEV